MRLNIYEKKKVVKTYEASAYDLMFGTVEDILEVTKFENITATSNAELVKVVADLALRSMGTVKYLLMDIFEGLSEEEIKHTKIKEVAWVLIEVIRFAVSQMGGGEKN